MALSAGLLEWDAGAPNRRGGVWMSDWNVKSSGPQAHDTRGKTAHQRLRRLDQFLLAFAPGLLGRTEAVAVDLGYGRVPITTLEWFERTRAVHSSIRMVGIERDADRVEAACSVAVQGLEFRRGDFQMPLESNEHVVVTRAMNVLRQYDEDAAVSAHKQILAQMAPMGLLAEGTCDPLGRIMVVALLRNGPSGVVSEGLLFARSFHGEFEPRQFQAVLPKHLIHRMVDGEPIEAFFSAWSRAAAVTRAQAEFGTRQHFVAAAEHLALGLEGVETRRAWLRNGWLLWRGAPYP